MSFKLTKEYHTKKRVHLFLCKPTERSNAVKFAELRLAAAKLGGWWSRKFGSLGGGFAFEDEASAKRFMVRTNAFIESENQGDASEAIDFINRRMPEPFETSLGGLFDD